MTTAEKIQTYIVRLPSTIQEEVLDFVEYLVYKADQKTDEEKEWSNLSLQMMMRGLEEEETPEYTQADLRVVFK
jgi:hypothetical protein